MFTLANNRLKPKVLTGRVYVSTYATRLDTVKKKKEEDKKKNGNGDNKDKTPWGEQTEKPGKDRDKKPGVTKKLTEVGARKKKEEEVRMLCLWRCMVRFLMPASAEVAAAKERNKKNSMSMWLSKPYNTYPVHVTGCQEFSSTEMLLNNQTDISIMKPSLLRPTASIEQDTW
jgi:hypothetical protein